ncbi:sensor histidine kinase [Kineococcus rubinsiae]|uniref:sensor histidine kinase n=1 Tax=Kineococcus rubinsiae TaxID=2609562 RepID=UPI0014315910|nr:histidine kinase [Kineococcus rubinsiae]NIZ91451.1 histidine kinase [Kineococcus rubinsiae]
MAGRSTFTTLPRRRSPEARAARARERALRPSTAERLHDWRAARAENRELLRARREAFLATLFPWPVPIGLAIVLLCVGVPVTGELYEVPLALSFVLTTLQVVSIPLAVRRPSVAVGLLLATSVLLPVVSAPGEWPWPWSVTSLLASCSVIAVLGLRGFGRLGLFTWWSSILLSIGVAEFMGPHVGSRGAASHGADLVVYSSNSALVLVLSVAIGARITTRMQLAAYRRATELEQSRRVVVEERNRIARELHDVVAHSMSVVQVQATTATYRIPGLDDTVRAEFDDIAAQARTALREMRTLLGVLREESGTSPLTPQPGLADVEGLAAGARRAGCVVDVEVAEALRRTELPSSVGLVVHRIVQEALANVVRHAHGAHVDVRLHLLGEAGRRRVVVSVRNGPPAAGSGETVGELDDGGHGLVGMRERAVLLGGSVACGPTDDGGFSVLAEIPLHPHERGGGS